MATDDTRGARLNFRLPSDLKSVIEQAASALGQTVSDYAVSTLVQNSRAVLEQSQTTILSNRDRQKFMALLEDAEVKPNKALAEAAKRYKKRFK